MRPPLTLLPSIVEPHVPLPLAALEATVEEARAISADLRVGLEAVAQRIWADSPAAAIAELSRLHARLETFEERFAALVDEPLEPRPIQGAA